MKKIKFLHGTHSDFSQDLEQQVKDYFEQKKISPYANAEMILVTALLFIIYTGAYLLLLTSHLPIMVMLLLVIIMGITFPSIFLNIAHTAAHNAFSPSKKVNRLLLGTLELIGMNAYIFEYLHNKVHHSFTSIEGADVIVEEMSILRLSANQPYNKMHHYQVWYAPFIYLLFSLVLVLSTDFQLFKRTRMGNIDPVRHPRAEFVKLYFFKAFYLFYILVLPMIVIDLPWWQVLVGFLIMHAVAGFFFSCVGVLNHQINESVFPAFDENGYIHNCKKDHELMVTIDFAPGSKLATYLFGGFNTHVAHHLFPGICHCHYPVITQMIRQTAPKYGLEYKQHTLAGAIRSHFRYLKRLSVPDNVPAAVI